MNTIIVYEKDIEKVIDYEGNHYFENFIFNEFKIILKREGMKVVYKISIKDKINEVTYRMIKGSKYKECRFSFIENEESIEFIESPNGELINEYVAKSLKMLGESGSKDDIINNLINLYVDEASFIAQLKQYIMNESYNRITIRKESGYKTESKTEGSKENKKSKKAVVQFLLGDIVEYVSSNRRKLNITCECWSVRGHFRHYKNGKVGWVNSYEKGKKRNTESCKSSRVYSI